MSFPCNTCSKICKRDDDLYIHKIQKLQCSSCQYCGHHFSGGKEIRRHMKSKHLTFPCSYCNKSFFLSAAVDTHTRVKHLSNSIYSGDMNRTEVSTSQATWFQQRSGEVNTKFLSDVRSCESLEKLLVNKIYPESDKTKTRNKIVNYLAKIMQHNIPTRYSTPGVFKGGSSGKGTSIETKADLDLLVNMNAYSSVAQLQRNMDTVLKDLRDLIEKNAHFASRIHFTRYTSHSIRFGVRVDPGDEMTEVDLLPAVDLGRGNRKPIFDQMKGLSNRDRSFYSVSFSKDQVEFVDQAPGAKDLIRVVKHWKKRENIGLVSYCIELIVIKQWMDGTLTGSLTQGLKQVMGEISRLSSMRITWPSRYTISQYGGLPSPPAVMDPANPFINTAEGVRDVATIERKAKEILNRM